jgi:hypothetical protein
LIEERVEKPLQKTVNQIDETTPQSEKMIQRIVLGIVTNAIHNRVQNIAHRRLRLELQHRCSALQLINQ